MIDHPERSDDRDSAIDALLAHVPFDGWTVTGLRRALAEIGQHPDDALLLFPDGAADMVAAFCDLADRRMATDATDLALAASRLPDRVRAVVAARLTRHRPHKEAVRRAMAVLALPQNAVTAAACTARTVDAIWHAAGITSCWIDRRAGRPGGATPSPTGIPGYAWRFASLAELVTAHRTALSGSTPG